MDSSMDSLVSRESHVSHQAQRHSVCWERYGFQYGSIQFFKGSQKHKKNSKFLIVDTCTGNEETPETVLRFLHEKWNLDLPKLLIHLVAADRQDRVQFDKMMGKMFTKELIDAIRHTDVWLLTHGLHHGITESLGKVLTDNATEIVMADQHQLVAIGIAPGQFVSQIEKLQQSVGGPVEYQMESANISHDDVSRCLLNPGHTHFIIEQDRERDALLLDVLVTKITQSKIQQTNATVPVVYVLFGGDEHSLLTIHNAVVERNTPVIIVAGSGGVADLLAGIDQPRSKSTEDDSTAQIKEIMCSSRSHLVTVHTENQKMDAALLLALMNANRGTRGQNELLLAVIWNRIHLARKELVTNKNWLDQFQEVQLAEALEYALIHNQYKFVEFFLDRDCIDLQKFLTRDRLVDLYHQVGPRTLLYKLLTDEKKENGKDLSSKPELNHVGNILKSLVELNSFSPRYLRDSIDDTFANPCRELFIWAVLQHHKKMAWVFWKHSGASIGGALMASLLLKSMSGLVKEPEISLEMFQHGRDFQDRAIEVMNRCYTENQRGTLLLLTQVLPDWGNVTCLELAQAARNKQFIGQAPVQSLLRKLWMGRLSPDTHLIMMWICMLFPIAAVGVVNFTPSDNLGRPTIKAVPLPLSAQKRRVHKISRNREYSIDELDGQYRSLPKGLFSRLTLQEATKPSRISWWYKVKLFIQAPVISFSYHLVFHLLFLLLFSYILLKDFKTTQSPLEFILMIWVVTLLFEELRELVQEDCDSWKGRFEAWLWGYWNIVDLVALVMFATGMALRYTHMLTVARIVLALDLIVFYLRILQFFSANKFLGPKLIMIVKMTMDIVTFICILFVFLVAYGVAFQSILYPNEQNSLDIVKGVLYQPYFQLYGMLFLEELHRNDCDSIASNMTTPTTQPCPENSWFGTVVLAFYLFISNIMLLNLLIAMFNYTFTTVQDNTDTYWKFQRFELVKEYHRRPVLAPPFIVFAHVYLLVRAFLHHTCTFYSEKPRGSSNAMRKYIHINDEQLYTELSCWEMVKGRDFLVEKEKQHNKDILYRIKQTDERLEEVNTSSRALGEDLMHRLDTLQSVQIQVDRRLSTIEKQMSGLEQLLKTLCSMQLQAGTASSPTTVSGQSGE
ncbi:transient receptor potential cation channel subfamily M member 2-like isoform X2 [Acanthaster planci]|nr:transient receptor potential cation channel subfamily M member 2-like isoform X2 [Acanthaster planci]XP_022096931.1 transient receptor potential cation channel subfamily M member 2-like isoform X2 [Acanthaster planci]XP_022096932.1 transient receptor potential cation channel subfamily M member 2-like isoform X2 [Acanthaster planci]